MELDSDLGNSIPLSSPKTRPRLLSSNTIDSGIFVSPKLHPIITHMPEKDDIIMECCKWCTETSDLILKVEESLFPVKRMVLWENSLLFRGILSSVAVMDDEEFNVLTLNGISAYEVEDILPHFYDPFLQVPGKNFCHGIPIQI